MTAAELRLLLEHATEAGMGRAWVIRGVRQPARITPEPGRDKWKYHLVGQVDPPASGTPGGAQKGGLLVLLYFPQGDGGEPGIEEV